MALDRIVVAERNYPLMLSWELVEQFADGIPAHMHSDRARNGWAWTITPVVPVDLQQEGFGTVYIKDESQNPTGTIKDRAAWELTALYRDFARALYLKQKGKGRIEQPVPRLSCITAGNVGRAVSEIYRRFGLPPMKLLVDISVSPERLQILRGLHADIYMADLGRNVFEKDDDKVKRPYTAQEIKLLTNNVKGIDITSVMALEPWAVFYDWHVHEAFNENAAEIYVPYGSGRIWENYLTWQQRTIRNDATGRRDTRLQVSAEKVIAMSILGAEPEVLNSKADKLTKSFNPFALFDDQDARALNALSFTGQHTGVYKVSEAKIAQA